MQQVKEVKKRKRGVKASRVKLEKALLAAGFNTQVALAEYIAELEQTDSIPKDLVNKVFREASVSINSIERIAKALGVEAFTLYLTSEELQHSDHRTSSEIDKKSFNFKYYSTLKRRNIILVSIVGGLFILWLSIYSSINTDHIQKEPLTSIFPELGSSVGRNSIAIEVTAELSNYAISLVDLLSGTYNVIPSVYKQSMRVINTREIEDNLQVDLVLNQQLTIFGRYWLLETYLVKHPTKIIVDRQYFTQDNFKISHNKYYVSLAKKLHNIQKEGIYFQDINNGGSQEYLRYLLEGIELLDHSNNLEKIKAAQGRFILAKKYKHSSAEANAGLCLAYLHESWSGNEKNLLSNAAKECELSKEISPVNNMVVTANGFLFRRTGRLLEAKNYVEAYINAHIKQADESVFLELGNIYLELYRQRGEKEFLMKGRRSLLKALQLAPNYWKVYFAIAGLEWSENNQKEAVKSLMKSAELDPNDLVLANLSAMSLCAGNISIAELTLSKILKKEPNSYLALEKMSMLKYLTGEFNQAINFRLQSINALGEEGIQEMWGALGDAYAADNQTRLAAKSYQKAMQLLLRDFGMGNQTLSHKVFRLYYQIRLNQLGSLSSFERSSIDEDLIKISRQTKSMDSAAIVRLALSYYYLNEKKLTEKYKKIAVSKCFVYNKLPEWGRE